MDIRVDPALAAPPFEQVRDQIAAQIMDGRLADQARLPAIRALATSLGLAANTVAKAYSELEASGLVVTAGRNGTRVVGQTVADAGLTGAADAYIAAARRRGLDTDALVSLVRTRAAS
ncbi:GntR family transcriptional regulator [Demequina capsici]|uniref:GntR family transcriptional regulator n=1 Tax=Demequina capsici TaxID=3075620 RepID=A0AA96JAA1_9MICO|nr:GntR family transcriptional regulator [Demequina sp. OYTSA14]WNM24421.1 GntR family transcriptional regulator [Demequina sp. OYTSA14]